MEKPTYVNPFDVEMQRLDYDQMMTRLGIRREYNMTHGFTMGFLEGVPKPTRQKVPYEGVPKLFDPFDYTRWIEHTEYLNTKHLGGDSLIYTEQSLMEALANNVTQRVLLRYANLRDIDWSTICKTEADDLPKVYKDVFQKMDIEKGKKLLYAIDFDIKNCTKEGIMQFTICLPNRWPEYL